MKVVLLTGLPGSGKTTVANRIHEHFSKSGVLIEGITTREIREGNHRVGFKIKDLSSGQEEWLARKESGNGPRIGSYRVVSDNLEKIGVAALERSAAGSTELTIIDEIGPMEMTSARFRNALTKVLSGNRATFATVKWGSHYPEVERIQPNRVILEISSNNREQIYTELIQQVGELIQHAKS